MLIYAFLPSSVFLTAVTLREPYQLLFVNLAVYGYLEIYLNRSVRHWVTVLIGVLGASLLHGVFAVWGVFLIFGGLLIEMVKKSRKFSLIRFSIYFFAIGIVLWYCSKISENVGYDFGGGLLRAITRFREKLAGIEARTLYASSWGNDDQADLLFGLPVIFFQYLFEPFIWRISNIGDGVLFVENILRGWLIWRALRALRLGQIDCDNFVSFIFVLYLFMEAMWSLGTLNWGTAVRHHVPAMGLLLLAAYARPGRKLSLRLRCSVKNMSTNAPSV
jgi:hypothetical protein